MAAARGAVGIDYVDEILDRTRVVMDDWMRFSQVITAYPLPLDLPATPLPSGAEWHTQGWQGALLRYASLVEAPDAEDRLLAYFRALQAAGMKLMRG